MKRILVRSGMLPQESWNDLELLSRDRFGSNNGNLIYQYSVIRTLMTENVKIFSDNYLNNPKNADFINENFDLYVIPLADAFRENFISKIKNYTKLIKRLNIPVIVIGVGLKAAYNYDVSKGFHFDNEVKEFVEAVLEKSNIIGLRGQLTADYLESLGFVPEKDFTVIGCPSMYTFGRRLNLKELKLKPNSKLSLNASSIASEESLSFLENISSNYKNYFFVPQSYNEFLLNYFGFGQISGVVNNFPKDIGHKFYKEGRVKFFLNALTWFDYIKTCDLSIGTRLHGNIVATINGIPSITIVHDARMRELAEYHALPSIPGDEMHDVTNLIDLVDRIDFSKVQTTHEKRFDHYINFLDQNNLDHIYKNEYQNKIIQLDELIKNINFEAPIETITSISYDEKVYRYTKGFQVYEKRKERIIKSKR